MPIPELSIGFQPPELRAYYEQAGAIILRNALSEDITSYFRYYCNAVFSIMDMKVHDLPPQRDDPLGPHTERYRVLQFIGEDVCQTLLATSHLRHGPGFASVTNRLKQILSFGLSTAPALYIAGKSALRRQGTQNNAQKSAYVPWHRDAHAVQTADLGNCVNCWVPVHAVGSERPSLQIVVGSHHMMKRRAIDYSVNEYHSDDDLRKVYRMDDICTVVLNPGDVLIFDHHTLHRTQPMGDAYPIRISGEFRFVICS
jgi:hypothetical protein